MCTHSFSQGLEYVHLVNNKYYANVAIGSFSRPCRVDRDFKVYFASRIA
jgi:hypothetical protein